MLTDTRNSGVLKSVPIKMSTFGWVEKLRVLEVITCDLCSWAHIWVCGFSPEKLARVFYEDCLLLESTACVK